MALLKIKAKYGDRWKDCYLEVADEIYNDALEEKKATSSLEQYVALHNRGLLKKYDFLLNLIRHRLHTGKIDITIERINIIK